MAWPVRPGVPAAGHVARNGAWHPGRVDGCAKCDPPRPPDTFRAPTTRGDDMDTPRFPDCVVQLSGEDGNAFAIIGRMQRALRRAGATTGEMVAFQEEAMSGDYDHLLATCMRWVVVE